MRKTTRTFESLWFNWDFIHEATAQDRWVAVAIAVPREIYVYGNGENKLSS